MASSSAFAIGTLRVMAAASAPSASTHFASGLIPTSSRSVDIITPVHSQHMTSPCVSCTVNSGRTFFQFCVLPEHSRKLMRDTDLSGLIRSASISRHLASRRSSLRLQALGEPAPAFTPAGLLIGAVAYQLQVKAREAASA